MTKLRCCTLYDITHTNVFLRYKPVDIDYDLWLYKRNTQCNFDTILQTISLRSLPEITQYPIKVNNHYNNFGTHYNDITVYWYFEFEVNSIEVFNNDFELLYSDCISVPMIICETEVNNIINNLDITPEFKNIHFEVIGYE